MQCTFVFERYNIFNNVDIADNIFSLGVTCEHLDVLQTKLYDTWSTTGSCVTQQSIAVVVVG